MTLAFAAGAFGAATNVESVVWRTIALVYLGLNGLVFLLVGLGAFAVVDIFVGCGWFGRSVLCLELHTGLTRFPSLLFIIFSSQGEFITSMAKGF